MKVIFHITISGATGSNFKEWIDILNREELKFPHIKIIYPTAPLQPYTPLHGMVIRQIDTINLKRIKQIDNVYKIIVISAKPCMVRS